MLTALAQKTLNPTATASDILPITPSPDSPFQKTVILGNGFVIKAGQEEDYEQFVTYTLFMLTHNGRQIYVDTCLTEYELGNKLYPILRTLDPETFELLVEVNDRPNKNYLKYFRIHQDKIVSTEKLPTFIASASNLDSDPYSELAGFWDWGETWGTNNSLTAYNPIIYYELRPTGITIDSILTIDKNKSIYGTFHGFHYNENIAVNISKNAKRDSEIDRISGKK